MEIYNIIADCPKCGRINPTTKWINDDITERMERYCEHCGYQWNEWPLDHPSNPDNQEANDV